MKKLTIAVAGNPNCGKTTLFNGLTGSTQHIGNWPGVTVEKISGTLLGNNSIEIVDLPGIYSLNAVSEDELVARDFMLSGKTDLVVNITDASNLERNLFLTLTLLEMHIPIILVLNMMDIAKRHGIRINTEKLSAALGIPVFSISALNNTDIKNIRNSIQETLKEKSISDFKVDYPDSIERVIEGWSDKLGANPRFTSVLLFEEDEETTKGILSSGLLSIEMIKSGLKEIQDNCGDTPDIVIAETKYKLIKAIAESSTEKKKTSEAVSEKIDRVVLNKWLGVPSFLAIIFLLFWVVTRIGGAFIDFFDILFGGIFVDGFGLLLERMGLPQWIGVILANGVGGGIQTVATFIPIIFTMFFMLSLLEDSGYMARASYVMDRFMRMIGLPGKAFVPMLVGFGCTVPAIMATRTLENKKDRYLTVFMTPFMSCGARLPVYALFGAAFFGRMSGLMVVSLYLFGIVMAAATGFLLKNTLFKGEATHFAMELPPYHFPRFRTIMMRTWSRLKDFITRAGQVIIIAVLILSFFNSLGTDGSFGNEDGENSVLAGISRTITPVFTPMGIEKENWPATVGLITGIFAKEAIVGTINSLYGQMASGESDNGRTSADSQDYTLLSSVRDAFKSIPLALSRAFGKGSSGAGVNPKDSTFTAMRSSFENDWARAYAYLLFVLIYIPCVAAMGAMI
ncbi:MAG: ferrous iron transporter B, partial [Spirochaetes bacterium]